MLSFEVKMHFKAMDDLWREKSHIKFLEDTDFHSNRLELSVCVESLVSVLHPAQLFQLIDTGSRKMLDSLSPLCELRCTFQFCASPTDNRLWFPL